MTYKLLKEYYGNGTSVVRPVVIRKSDNAQIPFDPQNRDYQEYLAWVAEGNSRSWLDSLKMTTNLKTTRLSL